MLWVVGIGMYLLIVFFLWLNEKRFNGRWLDLAAGSWIQSEAEEERPRRDFVAYSVSYPKADLSDFWKDFWR